MADIDALKRHREQRVFQGWDKYVPPQHVEASEGSLHRLVEDVIALGPKPSEAAVRALVDECVRRFNELDDGWICTIERDDIFEQVCQVVQLAGFECDEDWLDERDW